MSHKRLTKKEALKLITLIVDDEVDENTKTAFFRYVKNDIYVKKRYESAKRVKQLISTRCPVAKAPDRLRRRISQALEAERASQEASCPGEPVYDIQCQKTPFSYSTEDHPEVQFHYPERERPFYPWIYISTIVAFFSLLFWSMM